MWPFRRRREQTLNEMLLHEAGLDAEPSTAPGSARGPDYAVYAERLDGDLWEVRASPL
jgi:hypothetical protein